MVDSRTEVERTFEYVSIGSAESRHLQAGMARFQYI